MDEEKMRITDKEIIETFGKKVSFWEKTFTTITIIIILNLLFWTMIGFIRGIQLIINN